MSWFLAAALGLVSRGEGIQPQNMRLEHSLVPVPENGTADTLDLYVLLIQFRSSIRTSQSLIVLTRIMSA